MLEKDRTFGICGPSLDCMPNFLDVNCIKGFMNILSHEPAILHDLRQLCGVKHAGLPTFQGWWGVCILRNRVCQDQIVPCYAVNFKRTMIGRTHP